MDKKVLIFIFIFISCGPTDAEIQEQIEQGSAMFLTNVEEEVDFVPKDTYLPNHVNMMYFPNKRQSTWN